MSDYILWFNCCGNEIPLGNTSMTGHHDEYCLNCNTKNPITEVR